MSSEMNEPGHMTKVVTMPILMVKTFKKIFFRTDWPMSFKLGIHYRALKYYQSCSNFDPSLTFDLFTCQMSTLVSYAFV